MNKEEIKNAWRTIVLNLKMNNGELLDKEINIIAAEIMKIL